MSGQPSGTVVTQTPPIASKVVVLLRATGDAPILKQNKFKIGGSEKFAKVIDFLRKQLHRETVFVYINSAFSPNPDEVVMDLFNIDAEWYMGHPARFFSFSDPEFLDTVTFMDNIVKL